MGMKSTEPNKLVFVHKHFYGIQCGQIGNREHRTASTENSGEGKNQMRAIPCKSCLVLSYDTRRAFPVVQEVTLVWSARCFLCAWR